MQKMNVFYMILIINTISVFLYDILAYRGHLQAILSAIYHRLMTI